MKCLILFSILFFSLTVSAQIGGKQSRNVFEKNFAKQSEYINECRKTFELKNKSDLNVKPKIISGCEWSGDCPIKLPKPFYPNIAKRYKIFGAVYVEVFLVENGNAVYAKAKSGKKIFYNNAEIAAYNSQFRAVSYCGKKILQKKIIVYNFILN